MAHINPFANMSKKMLKIAVEIDIDSRNLKDRKKIAIDFGSDKKRALKVSQDEQDTKKTVRENVCKED